MPTHDQATYGLPEPDWHLMDPVTGDDLAAFAQLSEQAAADQLAREQETYAIAAPEFCECPRCECDDESDVMSDG
jgi:hypothetical protein